MIKGYWIAAVFSFLLLTIVCLAARINNVNAGWVYYGWFTGFVPLGIFIAIIEDRANKSS
jgi:hypothetical protein